MFIKAYASGGKGAGGGSTRKVSRPSKPTSVQGRFMAANGTYNYPGSTGRGRPARANYVAPRGRRG